MRGGSPPGSVSEAAVTALAGAVLGGLAGRAIGAPRSGALIAAVNGALGGVRGTYDWSSGTGRAAFVLDSTWALPTTLSGVVANLVNTVSPGTDFLPAMSIRKNRHVFGRGLRVRRKFATTLGNVVTNAAAAGAYDLREDTVRAARRRLLIEEHEELHVWQARWFGPFFPILYGGWMASGAVAGFIGWLRHGGSLGSAIETVAYYDNPFEYWAYVANRYWPPLGVHPDLAWRAPKHLASGRPDPKRSPT